MTGPRELLALGISHKTAPVALREKLALTEREAERFVAELASLPSVQEAVAISTCNRTEVYCVAADPVAAETDLLGKLARRAGIRPTELADAIYSPRNCDAARQLFRVTSGLESMIVGEAEVQGQVKRAYETALSSGTTGPLTNRMFSAALSTGKRVRTETQIGASRVSVSSVAVDLAREAVGDLTDRNVVIIGAGETSELTARALADQGVTTIFVANRHAQRALAMAERFGGAVVSLDELPVRLAEADIVVSSTSSPHPIVGVEELDVVMRARGHRPLLLIDIAVPRDIDPAVADLDGVHLRDVDDLQRVVERNLSGREAEAHHADALLERELERFHRWLETLDVVPVIAALHERGEAIARQVLAENSGRWEQLSDADRERLELMASTIVKRLLHQPIRTLKAAGEEQRTYAYVQALRELFGLESQLRSAFESAAADGGGRDEAHEAAVTPIGSARGRKQR